MQFIALATSLATVALRLTSATAVSTSAFETTGLCSPVTVTVTYTAPPVSTLSSTGEFIEPVTTTVSTTITEPASTQTVFQTVTDVFSLSPSEATSSDHTNGPYFFTISSGQTVWMGATPPSSMSFVLVTSTIEVYPTITAPRATSTSSTDTTKVTTTLFVTLTSTKVETVTSVSQSAGYPANSSGGFTSALATTNSHGPYTNSSLSQVSPPGTWSLLSLTTTISSTSTSTVLSVVPPSSTWSFLSINSTVSEGSTVTGSASVTASSSITVSTVSSLTTVLGTSPLGWTSVTVAKTSTDNCSIEATTPATARSLTVAPVPSTDTFTLASLTGSLLIRSTTRSAPISEPTFQIVNLVPSSAFVGERALGDTVYVTVSGTSWSWINKYSPITKFAETTENWSTVKPLVISDTSPIIPHSTSRTTTLRTSSSALTSETRSTTTVQPTHTSTPSPSDTPFPTSTPSPSNTPFPTSAPFPTNTENCSSTTGTSSTMPTTTQSSCPGISREAFTITFDDLPTYGEPDNGTIYPPIMSPYHDMQWSEGWSYVPPPSDPFLPSSGHQMGMFVVNGDANVHSQNYSGPIPSDADVNGMFGAGPNYAESAFWFDAHTFNLGCSAAGAAICHITVNGWKLNETSGNSQKHVQQKFTLATCNGTAKCPLTPIFLTGHSFSNLTALQFVAKLENSNVPQSVYADDIGLAWSNNSCAAIQARDNVFSVGPNRK